MPKYIDKDKLVNSLKEDCAALVKERWFDDYVQGYSSAIDDIIAEPEADVQEVRHGHWIEKDLDNFRKVECSCSICGWSGVENYDSYVDIHDFEFCPYCGAKMDGEE